MDMKTIRELLEAAAQLDCLDAFLGNRGQSDLADDIHGICARLRARIDTALDQLDATN